MRLQDATYWQSGELDKWGNPEFSQPELIKVRWEDRAEMFYDAEGRERRSQSHVGMGFKAKIGDYLILGDYTSESDPPEQAFEIKDFRVSPNLRNTKKDIWAIV